MCDESQVEEEREIHQSYGGVMSHRTGGEMI